MEPAQPSQPPAAPSSAWADGSAHADDGDAPVGGAKGVVEFGSMSVVEDDESSEEEAEEEAEEEDKDKDDDPFEAGSAPTAPVARGRGPAWSRPGGGYDSSDGEVETDFND
tara:strand:+ start:62 stop:394 length:333 start_codon:yes stop_codon:yes gene_type:complete